MLIEINCKLFKKNPLNFHQGLNTIVGDENATNSIGKSTLLMIIDFIFGGNTYLDHNKDVVTELGHHDFYFTFIFNKEHFYFRRGTRNKEDLSKCDKNYNFINSISLTEYNNILKKNYFPENYVGTFREMCSTFLRVWGKQNLDIKRPLHSFKSEKNNDTVNKILKIFGEYGKIENLIKEIQTNKKMKSTYNSSVKNSFIPKITKAKYKENNKEIINLEKQISDLKNHLDKYLINIEDLISDEILKLKNEKNSLESLRRNYENKIFRIEKTIFNKVTLNNKDIKKLVQFFPNINLEKVQEIENFHTKLTSILKNELSKEKKENQSKLDTVNKQIQEIDNKVKKLISSDDTSKIIIEKTTDIATELSNLKVQNNFYDTKIEFNETISSLEIKLDSYMSEILIVIEEKLNKKIIEINSKLYKELRRSPSITLTENNYNFTIYEDTGTGKAYTNLILLDLAFITMTCLPILIHDSLLFKNIGNYTIESIINEYNSFEKQVFISIDEINKFSNKTADIIEKKKIIQLSNNFLLFGKDWRK